LTTRGDTVARQVFLKKKEKLAAVAAALPNAPTEAQVVAKFKEMFPEDWLKIRQRYAQHERAIKPGKNHPMPEPGKYLLNLIRSFMRRTDKS